MLSTRVHRRFFSRCRERSHDLYKNFCLTPNGSCQRHELRIEPIVMILRNLAFNRNTSSSLSLVLDFLAREDLAKEIRSRHADDFGSVDVFANDW